MWATGSYVQSRLPGEGDRSVAVRTGAAIVTLCLVTLPLSVLTSLPPWIAAVSWAIGAFGMGLAIPSVSVQVMRLSPEADLGVNSSAIQIVDSVLSVVVIAMLGLGHAMAVDAGGATATTYAAAVAGLRLRGGGGHRAGGAYATFPIGVVDRSVPDAERALTGWAPVDANVIGMKEIAVHVRTDRPPPAAARPRPRVRRRPARRLRPGAFGHGHLGRRSIAQSTAASPAASASASSAPASGAATASAAAALDQCSKENLTLTNPGKLTIGTDTPAYPPYFVDDDPTNGKGFESAVAYAVADKLGFAPTEVTWTVVPFNKSYAPGRQGLRLRHQPDLDHAEARRRSSTSPTATTRSTRPSSR